MDERVLCFSKEAIKERKRNNYLLMIMIAIMIPVFSYYLIYVKTDHPIDIKLFLIIIGFAEILLMLEMFIVFKIMIKKIIEMKLVVSDTSITRVGGRFQESINYDDIKKVSVKRNKTNRILYIKISYRKKSITLSGFDDMDSLFMQLHVKLKDQSMIVEIKNKVNWNSPIVTVTSFAGTMLVMILIVTLDLDLYETLNLFFPLAIGVIFLFGKPVSKNGGARFRILEIVLSCILIVCGLIRVFLP